MTISARQRALGRLVRIFGWIALTAAGYVLLDSLIDFRPAGVDGAYRFRLGTLEPDSAEILRQDKLSIVVIRRSAATIAELETGLDRLQDPESRSSRQPAFAANPLRSRYPGYFVAYAFGTDLGCLLEAMGKELREICGRARYDFAGRALKGDNAFPNLVVPDYSFDDDFTFVTIRP